MIDIDSSPQTRSAPTLATSLFTSAVVVAVGYALAAVKYGKVATLAAITHANAAFAPTQGTRFAVCVDICGKRSSTVAGVMNTASQLCGSLSAVVFGYLVKASARYEPPLFVMSAITACRALLWLGVDASNAIGTQESSS